METMTFSLQLDHIFGIYNFWLILKRLFDLVFPFRWVLLSMRQKVQFLIAKCNPIYTHKKVHKPTRIARYFTGRLASPEKQFPIKNLLTRGLNDKNQHPPPKMKRGSRVLPKVLKSGLHFRCILRISFPHTSSILTLMKMSNSYH